LRPFLAPATAVGTRCARLRLFVITPPFCPILAQPLAGAAISGHFFLSFTACKPFLTITEGMPEVFMNSEQ
jgi:hypothetical protein